MAEVVWRDPFRLSIKPGRPDLSDMALNESIFPLQRERGVIVAVREGIVVICHTATTDSPLYEERSLEMDCSFVPEDRIESVTLYEPRTKENGTSGASRLDAAVPS
jgi:hypothetical protein